MSAHASRMNKSCACCERYMNHLDGKMKCFLRHMPSNYRRGMTIPDRFINHIGGEISESIEIESPDGNVYVVKVTKHMNKTVLQCGWEVFVNAHRIKENDSLLFQHIENSLFKVLILDSDGCEKVFPCSGIKITSNAQKRASEFVDISDSSYDYTRKLSSVRKRFASCQRDSPFHRRKAAKVSTTSASSSEGSGQDTECTNDYESSFELDDPETNLEPDYVLSRMSKLSAEQEEKVKELIKEIRPEIPVFVTIMKPSNVSKHPCLVIRNDYAAAHFPHKNQIVRLQRPGKNKKWYTKFCTRKDRSTHMFDGRWLDFVQDNHVQEGDICIFQPVKQSARTTFTVTVHLLRESEVHMVGEAGNSPGVVSSSRGRTKTKIDGPKTVSSSEGRPKAKVALTTPKEESAYQGPLESDDSSGLSKALYMHSSHTHLTGEQRKKVEESVCSIQSEAPIYVAIMTNSNVGTNSTCTLIFGKQYATKYLPDGEQTLTLLRKGKSTMWKVKVLPRRGDSYAQMVTVGWRDFVHDNHLEVEDICLFQKMKDEERLTMMVYIIRHG